MRVSVVCIAVVAGTCIAVTCDVARAQPDRIDSVRTPPSSAPTEFWTRQQLQAAQPMPLPVVEPSTPPSTGGPAEPSSKAFRSGEGKGPRRHDSGVSGNVSQEPFSRAGKLYFVKPEGNFVCSAQFIAPGILITAAHCVRDDKTGQWYTNVLYKHQYFRGQGRDFSTQCAATYDGWLSRDGKRWVWDYAMIKLLGGLDQSYFGWQSSWWGKYTTALKIGYPLGIEKGEVIQVEFGGQLIQGYQPGLVGLNHGNRRSGEGSSGGAWVGRYDPRGIPQSNYIISVTSHNMSGITGIDYGPYWDDHMESLMNYAKRGCR